MLLRTPFLIIAIPFLIFLFSCEELKESTSAKKNSQGAYGEIILVMDSNQWADTLGEGIRHVFQKAFPALPQGEAYFNLRHVRPAKFEGLLKNHSTIMYVTTFDNNSRANQKIQSYFSTDSKEKIEKNKNQFVFTRNDEFARNQLVIHLFGRTEEELLTNIRNNDERLIDLIDKSERNRIYKDLYKGKEEKELTNYIRDKNGYGLRIPFGYDLATEKSDFLWFTQLGTDLFRNLIIATKPYQSEADFAKDSVVQWRNQLGKTYLFGSGEKDTVSYMLTDEKYVPVFVDTVEFNRKFAIEYRGLWKLKNNTRGGPFLTYVFVDESRDTMYYIEAFLYAPNKIKRHIMRELEAVLHSFKSKSDLENNL